MTDKKDTWFAWYPVRLGALGIGRWVWLKRVWRDNSPAARFYGVRIYQSLETAYGKRTP